ncbi:hypothetical protein FHG87_024018 [Trinorchestia longiramus]|nr:hypothetical protein FHG87_024018 [Trinorchestia longiramus]
MRQKVENLRNKVGMGAPLTSPAYSSDASILCSINEEFIALYDYLEKHQVCGAEAERVLQPLHEVVNREKLKAPVSADGVSVNHQLGQLVSELACDA